MASMRFATFFLLLFVVVLVVFVSPNEALPLLGRRSFRGSSHEILVPVQVIPTRRVGILVIFSAHFRVYLLQVLSPRDYNIFYSKHLLQEYSHSLGSGQTSCK